MRPFKLRPTPAPRETSVLLNILRIVGHMPGCLVLEADRFPKSSDPKGVVDAKAHAFRVILERATQGATFERPGLICWRQNTGGAKLKGRRGGEQFVRFALPGTPDIVGVVVPYGVWFGIEVKRRGGEQNPAQRQFEEMLLTAGGVYLVIDDALDARNRIEEALAGLVASRRISA